MSKVPREAVSKIYIVFNIFRLARRVSPSALNVSYVLSTKINWPTKIRSVYGISEMATTHELVNDEVVQMWPYYPCLYGTRAPSFKSRDVRQLAMENKLLANLNKPVHTATFPLCLLRPGIDTIIDATIYFHVQRDRQVS